jgi:membrane-bound lytic murein transglycosylase D
MQAYAFVEKENEIANYRANELLPNRTTVTAGANTSRTEKVTHKVAAGETVLSIAHKYGVSAAEVRKWNRLGSRTTSVAAGRNLILNVDNGGYTLNNTTTNSASKPATVSSTTESKEDVRKVSTGDTEKYRIKSGDSFYSIAQRYPGYTYSDLMKLNNMTNPNVKIGQYILVPKI